MQKKLLDNIKIITPSKNQRLRIDLKKIWQYRNLIFVFALRDIKVQYAQTKFGVIWSLIQAITAALIINLFFGTFLNVSIPKFPYLIFSFPGMMAWYYFSYIVTSSGTALMQSQNLIKKVYFPKLILPLYKTFVGLFEFIIWFLLFIIILIIYKQPLYINILFLPIGIILNIMTGLSVALWLCALTVRYRDVLLIIPYLVGFGIFVTPVFYTSTMIPEAYKFFVYLNPMAGVLAIYRWCLLDINVSINYLFGLIPMFILFISGLYYFKRVEGIMADLI